MKDDGMCPERVLGIFREEVESIPPIRFLDDYIHFRDQLTGMRKRARDWKGTRVFAAMPIRWGRQGKP